MEAIYTYRAVFVNCRIGSLENVGTDDTGAGTVNCRIGSLEISTSLYILLVSVNCRIGSLEKFS